MIVMPLLYNSHCLNSGGCCTTIKLIYAQMKLEGGFKSMSAYLIPYLDLTPLIVYPLRMYKDEVLYNPEGCAIHGT